MPEVICVATPVPASVVLRIVDPAGTPLSDIALAWRVDDGPTRNEVCANGEYCPLGETVVSATGLRSYIGQTGSFVVTASKAGFVATSATIVVSPADCLAITEQRTLTLTSAM